MSDLNAALTEIQRMEKTFKAFQEAANAIKVLAGYEQNVTEIKARIDALNEEGAKQVSINTDLAEWAKKVKAATAKAVADAKAKAEGMINKAEADIVQRREEADANLNNTATALAALEEQHAELQKAVEAKKAELAAAESDIDAARATIAKIRSI